MVLVGVSFFLLLSSLGLVVTAQDCTPPTAGAHMVLRDSDILQTSFPDGSKATFVCESGYTTAGGSGVVTCTAGTWSSVALKCERRNCGNPGEVENGQIDFVDGSALFGDRIVISCKRGYRMVGKSQIFCGAKGWMDRLPFCEVVQCLSPPNIVNGVFSPDKEEYNFGEVIEYTCDKGFTLNGSNSRTCSDNDQFAPKAPTCIKVLCSEHKDSNAEWEAGARPPYGHLASVTYRCKFGSKAQFTVLCGLDSAWTPKPPKCEADKVPPIPTKPTPTTKKVTPTADKVPPIPTKPTPTTKKVTPTGSAPITPPPPGDGGSTWATSWWFIILAITICVCIGASVWCAFIKNKHCFKGSYSGNVATNDEEEKL